MAEPTYPFLFPNHGPIDPECIGKCAELWMWFARDVTPAERKKIEERAPPPLSCFMGWDRRFAYFGSAGDSYDAEVIQHYCPPELVTAIAEATSNQDWTRVGKLYQKAQDHFDEAAVAFAMDVERWAREVHEIAPLVVFFGPHGGGGDDDAWHRHSQRALGRVMLPVLAEYQASAEGKRCFGYIKKVVQGHLSRHADEVDLDELRPGLMASIEDGYRSADLSVPFGRLLSSSDAPLQHLGANVQRALSDLPDGERRAWIERLSPFARLCYLASYSAAGSRDLDRFGDLPSYLRGLLAELPRERAHLGPWLLLWTAETLAQDTCAFDKKKRDTSRAGDAAQVLDVALEVGSVYVFDRYLAQGTEDGAMGLLMVPGEEERVVGISDSGLIDPARPWMRVGDYLDLIIATAGEISFHSALSGLREAPPGRLSFTAAELASFREDLFRPLPGLAT